MIHFLVGENSFEIDRELRQIVAGFSGDAERIDGAELELRQIPDLLMGVSLFAEKRLVVIKNLSENKAVWADFSTWLDRLSDDIHLVLVEAKPDKRTKTYKDLQKIAKVIEYKPWGERDTRIAEQWAAAEAQRMGVSLTPVLVRQLVGRTGVDQWRVFRALEKLQLVDEVTAEVIDEIIEQNPSENVFALFETALKGDGVKVHQMIQTLEATEDPHKVLGLLSGQVFQLAALVMIDKPSNEIAKDISAHPFVLSKLAPLARQHDRASIRKLLRVFVDTDAALKSTTVDPWLLIERALIKTTQL